MEPESNEGSLGRAKAPVRPCVLIPTYDNAGTVVEVVEGAKEVGLPVIVVLDGPTDGTAELVRAIEGITILEHAENRGKGAALRTGFEHALRAGFSHAVTLDSDGQHDPARVADFVEAVVEDPRRLVLGNRDMEAGGAGPGSLWGRRNSNFWTWVETGLRLPDTQTGFRCYPLRALAERYFACTGFDFEIEVIVKLAWAGTPVHSIPVPVRYFEGRVSHMRPVGDFLRIGKLNTRLVFARIWLPTPYLELATRRQFAELPRVQRIRESFRELFVREPGSSGRIGLSAGMGFFIGLSPIWGYQVLVTILASHKLGLSKTVALLSAHISLPPFVPFIIYGSLVIGRVMLGQEPGEAPTSLEVAPGDLPAWLLGSFSLAAVTGLVGGLAVYGLVSSARRLRRRAPA